MFSYFQESYCYSAPTVYLSTTNDNQQAHIWNSQLPTVPTKPFKLPLIYMYMYEIQRKHNYYHNYYAFDLHVHAHMK